MSPQNLEKDVARLQGELFWTRRFAFWMAAIATGSILVAIAAIIFGRTIIAPPSVDREMWISGFAASPEYLEDQSHAVLDQLLSASPDNVVARAKRLARFAHPDDRPALAEDLQASVDFIKKHQIESSWTPVSYQVDPRRLSVTWVAQVTHRVGNTPVVLGSKRFLVQFRIRFGRLYLSSAKEIKSEEKSVVGDAGDRR